MLAFSATALAESIVVLFHPNARVAVLRTAEEFGYRVLQARSSGAMIEIPEADNAYSEFLLRIFANPDVLRIHRKERSRESLIRFSIPKDSNSDAVAELLTRLENIGAKISKIHESDQAFVDVSVPPQSLSRVRLELQLARSSLGLETIVPTHGTTQACQQFFSF
jgi:hypothetical protein